MHKCIVRDCTYISSLGRASTTDYKNNNKINNKINKARQWVTTPLIFAYEKIEEGGEEGAATYFSCSSDLARAKFWAYSSQHC